MTVLVIILGILVLLALVPVGIRAVFDGTLTVHATVLGIRFRLYPAPKKTKKKSKQAQKAPAKTPKAPAKNPDLQAYLQLAVKLLGKLKRKLLLKELTLHAIFGGKEPELNYGRAWAAIGLTFPLIEETFRIRKRDVGAYYDRGEESIRLYARAHAILTVFGAIHIALHALRGYLKIKNTKPEKAVQTYEQSDQ